MNWTLSDARSRFNELVKRALAEGPQWVRRRGESVVILSEHEYEKLRAKRSSFKDALLNGPGLEGLEFPRDQSPMREVDL